MLAVKWNLVVSTIAFIAFQFFPQSIISLFGDGNELYFEFAVLFMRTYLFMVLVWCAVAFFQLFYRNRKIVKRCSVGINKADLFVDSAYPAAPASFRNYGSIACGACC